MRRSDKKVAHDVPSNLLATSAPERTLVLDDKQPAKMDMTMLPTKLPLPPLGRLRDLLQYAKNELPYREDTAIMPGDIKEALCRAVDHFVYADPDGKRYDWKSLIQVAEAVLETEIREGTGYQTVTIAQWEANLRDQSKATSVDARDPCRKIPKELISSACQRLSDALKRPLDNVVSITPENVS